MNFFISDHHFCHNKPFIYESRGFKSIEEHDEEMIRRFNSKVSPEDTTYYGGDFCFDEKMINGLLSRMNGKIIFILGNHDKALKAFNHKQINWARKHSDVSIPEVISGYHNIYIGQKQPLTICHFAMHSWEKSHFNSMHVYGHHHSKTDFGGKTLNISVDNIDGYPISEVDLLKYMEKRPNNWDYLGDRE